MFKLFLLTISLLIFFALNSSSQIVHAQVSDTEEKEKVSENFSQDLIKNLERISKNISQLTTLYLKKFRDYIDAQIAKETTSDKEIKQSDTYNEAAKKLAEIEAKIKVEKAFIAYMEKDYKKAYKLLSPLAEQGNDKAQFTLGLMFNDGQGVPQDYEEAIKWFRLAAEQENHKAQMSLGLLYKDGQGVIKDLEEAMKLVTLAADGGIPLAQYYLGLWLHAKGLEKVMESTNLLNPDLVAKRMEGDRPEKEYNISAHKWLNLSISNFDARTQSRNINNAKKTRSKIEKELQPIDLKEAQRLAKEWTKSHNK
jgi:TPR repeat protein